MGGAAVERTHVVLADEPLPAVARDEAAIGMGGRGAHGKWGRGGRRAARAGVARVAPTMTRRVCGASSPARHECATTGGRQRGARGECRTHEAPPVLVRVSGGVTTLERPEGPQSCGGRRCDDVGASTCAVSRVMPWTSRCQTRHGNGGDVMRLRAVPHPVRRIDAPAVNRPRSRVRRLRQQHAVRARSRSGPTGVEMAYGWRRAWRQHRCPGRGLLRIT